MEKIALFIAGDERIYFPAIVTILSIKKHNPDDFDFFLCFDERKLSEDMRETLNKNQINFIDNQKLNNYEIEKTFKPMTEGAWPVEVFYNYVLPIHLGEMGYKFSIKADYDLLCIGKYELNEIIPYEGTVGGLSAKVSLLNQGVRPDIHEDLQRTGRLGLDPIDYMNVGFITFNNERFVRNKCFESFIEIYQYLADKNPEAKLLEQIAFSLLLFKLKGDYITFTDAYNHRVLWTKPVDSDLKFDVKNIHYITQFKPWKPIDLNMLRRVVFRGRGCLFSYRNLWLEFAESLPSFEKYCNERRLTELELTALQMLIVKNYNERVSKLEKELINEQRKYAALKSAIQELSL